MFEYRHGLLLVLLLILATGGCHWYPQFDRNLQERLEETEIIGAWKLTEDSQKRLLSDKEEYFKVTDNAGFASSSKKIILRSDGTCSFDSVVQGFTGSSVLKIAGTWVLEHDSKGDSNVTKKNALRLNLVKRSGFVEEQSIVYFNFVHKNGELMLWNYLGDPDSCQYIEYFFEYGEEDPCVAIPGGTYRSINEYPTGKPFDGPAREITITTFTVARRPITFQEFLTFINDTQTSREFAFYDCLPEFPVRSEEGIARVKPEVESCPAYNVTYVGAMKFLEWKSGKDAQYNYRLPTQFEFEYLASNGGTTQYPWGNVTIFQDVVNPTRHQGEYVFRLPAGSLRGNGNRWDVYDLIGSVDQWTPDYLYPEGKFAKFSIGPAKLEFGENDRITFGGMDVPACGNWWESSNKLPTAYSYFHYWTTNQQPPQSDACRMGFRWVREEKR